MRPLWPIERAILELAAAEYPASTEAIRQQIDNARVTAFENTGAGFFSEIALTTSALRIPEKSPLDASHGEVLGVRDGMGFIIFLKDGIISTIEGYCQGDGSTADVDFSRVVFGLMPWGSKPDLAP